MHILAALYVAKAGTYYRDPDFDPYDESRDARRYHGNMPVVAHPPCQRWGHYAQGSTRKPFQYLIGADGGCFAHALDTLQRVGGVIEHPAYSLAWQYFGLQRPQKTGWTEPDRHGFRSCYVEQGHYGHFSRKPTWLLYKGPPPFELVWGRSEQRLPQYAIERYGYEKARKIGVMAAVGGSRKTEIRNATPEPFKAVLKRLALLSTANT